MSDDLKYIELPSPPLGTENEAAEGKEDVIGKNGMWPDTELDLNTSGNLPGGDVATGVSPNCFTGTTRSALTTGCDAVANPDGWVLENDSGLYLTHDQFAALKLAQDRAAAEPYPTSGDIG